MFQIIKKIHSLPVLCCILATLCVADVSVQAETITIPAAVPRLKQTLRVPRLLPRRCRFVLLRVTEDNHCSFDNSTVTITGPEPGAQGVTVTPGRKVHRPGNLTLIPLKVCLDKAADTGEWTIQCDTDVADAEGSRVERIEASITVSEGRDRTGDNGTRDARGSVYGRVFDTTDDAPLPGVTISAPGATAPATTDADGWFCVGLSAAGTFGITATRDGYTYAQREAVLETADDIVSVSDMYLTPIDPTDISIGPAGGIGSNSDGSIQLDVPAGALDRNTAMQATWYDRGRELPNALPDLSHFTYACDLTPDGQRFDKPVTVRMRNERGFAPGTPIPVGVYDPDTMQWQHESMGVVSEDGEWAVFEVEHFSPRDCNLGRVAPSGSGDPGDARDSTGETRTERNNQNCGSVRAGSRVDVQDGHLLVEHILPSYRSMGRNRMLALQYNSPTASTGITLQVSYDISQTSVLMPERIRFVAEIGGNRIERFYDPIEGPMVFACNWDGRDPTGARLAEGTYNYRLTIANEYQTTFATVPEFGAPASADTGVPADEYMSLESSFTGSVFLDRADDVQAEQPWLGHGWGLVGMYALSEQDDRVVITGGDNSRFMFTGNGAGIYSPARGDSSMLSRLADGGYQWQHQNGTVVTFTEVGNLGQVQDRNGNTTTYTWDSQNRLRSITDPAGKVTFLTISAAGTLTSITDPAGRTTSFTIDRAGDLVAIVNPDDSARYFTCDDSHRMISQTDAGGNVTTYTYSDRDAVVRVDRPDGSHTEHTADYYGQPAYTDPGGNAWLFGVNSFGTRTAITDPLHRTITMQRDTSDRITGLIMPSGKTTYYTYDDNDNLSGISWFGGSAYPSSVALTWDPELNVLLKLEDDIAGTWTCTYDSRGNLLTARTADGRTCSCTYNDAGQRTSLSVGDATETYEYTEDGNLASITDPAGGVWFFSYDDFGNLAEAIDPDGRSWSAAYTVMNLLSSFTNGAGERVTFTCSPARGSVDLDFKGPAAVVTAVTDGRGNTTAYTYDAMYRLTGITDALGNTTAYAYDSAGRLTSVTRPTGDMVTYSYNRAGQLIGKELSSGESMSYSYDNETGLPVTLTTSLCRLDYTYNRYDMLSAVTTAFLDSDIAASVSYNYRQGNYAETKVRLARGESWMDFGYEWDRNGWLPTDRIGGGYFWLDLTYGDGGRLSEWYESYTGTSAAFSYDAAGRMIGTGYAGSGGGSGALSWQYSPAGDCTRFIDPQGTHAFSYDAAGRLTGATHPEEAGAAESYTYDAAGNRRTAGQEAQFIHDAADCLTSDPVCTYTYDAAGNLISKTARTTGDTTSYTYDAESRLIGVTLPDGSAVSYAYDAIGRRCRRTAGTMTTNYVYDRHNVLAELSGSGSLVRSYVAGPGVDALTGIKQGGFAGYSNYYTFSDRVGSVLVLTDEYGDPVEQYTYSAFGELLSGQDPPESTRLFAGADYDPAAGLYYLRRRFYDPATGRFIQRDPLPLQSALSPYIYAGNDPVNRRDPFGLETGTPAPGGSGPLGILKDRAAQPAINHAIATGIGDLPARTEGILPPMVDLIMPDVATMGVQVWNQYNTWNTVIDVFGADNPAQAGIDWYATQPWNPARAYLDDFLTLGGLYERREARIHPICGLREGLGLFFGL